MRYDYGEAIASFVADCRRMRVRSVLQFDFGDNSYLNAAPALADAGIPDDVRLVSFSNAKSGLVCFCDTAQFVFDPFKDGRAIAECALEWLRTGRLGAYRCPAVYCRGASFPVR